MRRIAIGAGALAGLAIFFLLPLLPIGIVHSNSTICPNPTQLCSTGDGSIFFHGLGSPSSRLIGYGGAWNYQLNKYELGSHCSTAYGTYQGEVLCWVSCTLLVPDRVLLN